MDENADGIRSGRCRSCNAQIVWVRLVQADKWHICNPPVKMFVRNFSPTNGDHYHLQDCYESHFNTCPDANDWRKDKRKEDANGR